MGRTKDLLRDNIPFSPGSFGSMEEFAAAIGWDLSTKQSSRSSDARHNGMLSDDFQSLVKDLARAVSDVSKEHDYQALVASVVQAAIHFEDDQQGCYEWEAIENHVDEVLSQYIRKVGS